MTDLTLFKKKLEVASFSTLERAVALLWFYTHAQQFEERTAKELADELHGLGFSKPNGTRLHEQLTADSSVVKGKRPKTFQINSSKRSALDSKFSALFRLPNSSVTDAVIPMELFREERPYFQQILRQINGGYDNGWFDGCAVLCRRLVEILIIEIYVVRNLRSKIEENSQFKMFDGLISVISNETNFRLPRGSKESLGNVKSVGDRAAHDRFYLTKRQDIDDIKLPLRALVVHLIELTKLK